MHDMKIDLTNRNVIITITNNIQTYYSMSDVREPDPNWHYVDGKGHAHAWNLVSKEVTSLEKVIDEIIEHPACDINDSCCDCNCDDRCEAWTETKYHLACKLCGEEIEPGKRIAHRSGYPYYIPGNREITGQFTMYTADEFDEIMDNRSSIEFCHPDLHAFGYITEISYNTHGDDKRTAKFICLNEL
jgi:hypothetical protein